MKNKILSIAVAGLLVIGQLQLTAFADSTSTINQTDGLASKPIYAVTLYDSDFKAPDSPTLAAPSDTKDFSAQDAINLTVGQTTSISQNEGGIAGIMWKYTIGDNSIVDLKSENTVSPPSVVYDGLSSHTWTFIAKKAGTTDVTFTSRFEKKVYTIIVSDPKADKKVDMKVGERLCVQLKQNIQTGKWQAKIKDNSIIGLESDSSPSINPIFSGIHKWVFRAKKAGSTTITFTAKKRTINVLVNVTDIAPAENVIKLKVGGTTTISDPMGGLVGMKHTIKILDTSIIDITDYKVIPPPEGTYDLPNTEVWTITAKKPGTTSIIDTYTSRVTSSGESKTYTVIVTK